MPERQAIRWHEDPVFFREAINFTAAETGFLPRLIEKDYFCTVLLLNLTTSGAELVFRGGTCLSKIHAGFYRLSEDLDFLIPAPVDSMRAERRRLVATLKKTISQVKQALGLPLVKPLAGANISTQYAAVVGYDSLISPDQETIKIEVGLREPLMAPAIRGEVRTLLMNPVSGLPLVAVFQASCLSREEAMAEKLRAALTRREPAVRDFFDVDYAVRRLNFRTLEPTLINLVAKKLAVPGNDSVDVSAARLTALRPQVESQLKPVLRDSDFVDFDLDRAFATVAEVSGHVTRWRAQPAGGP